MYKFSLNYWKYFNVYIQSELLKYSNVYNQSQILKIFQSINSVSNTENISQCINSVSNTENIQINKFVFKHWNIPINKLKSQILKIFQCIYSVSNIQNHVSIYFKDKLPNTCIQTWYKTTSIQCCHTHSLYRGRDSWNGTISFVLYNFGEKSNEEIHIRNGKAINFVPNLPVFKIWKFKNIFGGKTCRCWTLRMGPIFGPKFSWLSVLI